MPSRSWPRTTSGTHCWSACGPERLGTPFTLHCGACSLLLPFSPLFRFSPNADVKDAALCYAVQNSPAAFEAAIDLYMNAYDSTERAQYAAALSCTLDHALLERLMEGIIVGQDGTSLNAADLQQLINAILSRWENHRFMLNYFKGNWRKIFAL